MRAGSGLGLALAYYVVVTTTIIITGDRVQEDATARVWEDGTNRFLE